MKSKHIQYLNSLALGRTTATVANVTFQLCKKFQLTANEATEIAKEYLSTYYDMRRMVNDFSKMVMSSMNRMRWNIPKPHRKKASYHQLKNLVNA